MVELPQGAGDLRVLLGFWHDDQRLPVDAPAPQDGTQRMVGPLIRGAPGVPEIHVRRTASAPRIDGVLDDAAWSAAAPLTLVDSLDGSKPELRTIARLSWDDQALYVAFECEDPDVWGTLRQRDEPLYTQDVVEVFLDADADGRTLQRDRGQPAERALRRLLPGPPPGMDLSWDSGW